MSRRASEDGQRRAGGGAVAVAARRGRCFDVVEAPTTTGRRCRSCAAVAIADCVALGCCPGARQGAARRGPPPQAEVSAAAPEAGARPRGGGGGGRRQRKGDNDGGGKRWRNGCGRGGASVAGGDVPRRALGLRPRLLLRGKRKPREKLAARPSAVIGAPMGESCLVFSAEIWCRTCRVDGTFDRKQIR
jgi:hypothetical protein